MALDPDPQEIKKQTLKTQTFQTLKRATKRKKLHY